MPAQTRAPLTSLSASENRSKLLVVCELLLKALKAILSLPKKSWSVWTNALLRQACEDGWSGNGGVAKSGIQLASGSVAGLPSLAASWIAVTGRQKLQ